MRQCYSNIMFINSITLLSYIYEHLFIIIKFAINEFNNGDLKIPPSYKNN